MREPAALLAACVAIAWLAGHGVAALFYRRRLRRLMNHMRLRLRRRMAARERRFAVLHDRLLQDVQGVALSLQAAADQLPPNEPVRRRLELLLDRIDELLADARRRVHGGGPIQNGPN